MTDTAKPQTIGPNAQKPNPMLQAFEPLIGDWLTTGGHPYIPGVGLHGKTSFAWIEDGSFVIMRTEVEHPEIPDGIAIFGSDDSAGTYHMLYFDERGVSRKFDVALTETGLTWHRNDAHLSQRVTLEIMADKLVARGEMSENGGAWGPDLSLTYTKQ